MGLKKIGVSQSLSISLNLSQSLSDSESLSLHSPRSSLLSPLSSLSLPFSPKELPKLMLWAPMATSPLQAKAKRAKIIAPSD